MHVSRRACLALCCHKLGQFSRAVEVQPSGMPRHASLPLCATTVPEISRGRGAPGSLSARHSLAVRSHSSVLQNGCSSTSLNRLRRALGRKHSSCRLLP